MTPRWRLAAVLAVCMAIGFGCWYFWSHRDATPQEMASYVPADEAVLSYVNVKALRQAGLLSILSPAEKDKEVEYRKFVAQSGFDYERDLDALLVSLRGEKTYSVAKGRFDWSALSKYATSHGGHCQSGYCVVNSPTVGRILSFHLLRANLLAFASANDEWAASAIAPGHGQTSGIEIPSDPVWLSLSPYYLKNRDQYPGGMRLFAKVLENATRILLSAGPDGEKFAVRLKAVFPSAPQAEIAKAQMQQVTTTLNNLIVREGHKPNPNDLSGVLSAGTFRTANQELLGSWPLERGFLQNVGGGAAK